VRVYSEPMARNINVQGAQSRSMSNGPVSLHQVPTGGGGYEGRSVSGASSSSGGFHSGGEAHTMSAPAPAASSGGGSSSGGGGSKSK
jgi:hypothetical protein